MFSSSQLILFFLCTLHYIVTHTTITQHRETAYPFRGTGITVKTQEGSNTPLPAGSFNTGTHRHREIHRAQFPRIYKHKGLTVTGASFLARHGKHKHYTDTNRALRHTQGTRGGQQQTHSTSSTSFSLEVLNWVHTFTFCGPRCPQGEI